MLLSLAQSSAMKDLEVAIESMLWLWHSMKSLLMNLLELHRLEMEYILIPTIVTTFGTRGD